MNNLNNKLRDTVFEEIVDEVGNGVNGYHVHFDDPRLEGLVPEHGDLRLIEVARSVARLAARREKAYVVVVPLPGMMEMPETFTIEGISALDRWEPPGIYYLPDGLGEGVEGSRRFDILDSDEGVYTFIGVDPDADHEIDPETPPFRAYLYFVTQEGAGN